MSLTLSRYLVALGYGTRKEAERIVRQRRVTTAGGTVLRDTDRYEHDDVFVDRTPLEAPPGSVILLHKPVGFVCSLNDRPPMIYDLLPATYPKRTPVMASILFVSRSTFSSMPDDEQKQQQPSFLILS